MENKLSTLQLLMHGHRRYLNGVSIHQDLRPAVKEFANGQKPRAIVVTCADSRVPPEHIFDSGLGELFVIRIAGNIITDEAIASIEFAHAKLGSDLCIVMGHTGCGAIDAAISTLGNPDSAPTPNLAGLVRQIHPAIEEKLELQNISKLQGDLLTMAAESNALFGVELLSNKSNLLQVSIRQNKLKAVAAIYHLKTGEVQFIENEMKQKTAVSY